MDVFILGSGEVQHLIVESSADWDVLWRLKGQAVKDVWQPVKVRFVRETVDRPGSDFPYLTSHVPVFSSNAVARLRTMLQMNGELLPLECGQGTYFAMNVFPVIDALDWERSVINRMPSGQIAKIREYRFFEEQLKGVTMFRLPQQMVGNVFVTDLFVHAVEAASLTGFQFHRVWSSTD